MGEPSLSQTRDYYRKRARSIEAKLARAGRYRGRIHDVRERDQWARLADEIDSHLAGQRDPDEPATASDADVPLFA